MYNKARIIFLSAVATIVILVAAGCSTSKNTSASRWWHAFNARYNTYYNGTLAYIDASLEKETGNRDNFTEMIPLYTVGNKASREIGKSNYDRAILKAEKAIHQHSIKRRPQWNKQRRKTARDIEWLNRREYNPFLWKAWMLMGRSQFFEGDFEGAASTFSYMSRLYETQPAIYGRARAWLAKSYIENGFLYDAEDVIRNMERDSIHWRAQKEWDYTYADYYIHTGDYAKAIPYLRKVIRHEMRRKQRAREWYLMGQLYEALGLRQEAYKAYGRVVRLNPPYELAFNARISQTEVLATGKQSGRMVRRLKRMARSDNNKEYLDQVYFALGNIFLAQGDTAQAISYYEQGNEKSTRTGIEKGVLLLKLGDLYWTQQKFNDAQRCYGAAIGMLDKERPDYEQLAYRSKVLDELVPYTDAVHLQDSLQSLARMDEADRNAAIDRVIDALKKQERAERRAQQEQDAGQALQDANATGDDRGNNNRIRQRNVPVAQTSQQASAWYFYNPLAVQQGKQIFQRTWGKRENVDDWQRNNKTVVAGLVATDSLELTDEQRDSIYQAQLQADSLQQIADSAQNDPHKREYYLAQIPFTEDQVKASDAIIMDGLFHSGVIFKDKLDNLPLSEKALRRLTDHYPSYEHMDEAYYHLFLLYSREGEPQMAQAYVDSLRKNWPESKWTTLLTDPNYVQNAREGVHLEDSLYAATYEAFKAGRNREVKANTELSASRFPMGANRDKFLFIGALGKLNDNDADGCLDDLNTLVKQYPTSKLSEMAGMIINGVKQGRTLRGGRFDLTDMWNRRTATLSDSVELKQQELSNERNTKFNFLFVYAPDSVQENKLLYQVARYNFTSFLVRDFQINIDNANGIHRMRISGFRNYDEALQYARLLLRQPEVSALTKQARPVIVSDVNLPLLGTVYSYDDYAKFYNRHFAPLKVSTVFLLTQPVEVVREKEPQPEEEPTPTDVDNYLNDTYVGVDQPEDSGTTIVEDLDLTPEDSTTTVPVEEPQTTVTPEPEAPAGTTVVPAEEPQTTVTPEPEAPAGTTVVPAEEPQTAVTPEPETPITTGEPQTTVVPTEEPQTTVTLEPETPVITTESETPVNAEPQPESQRQANEPATQVQPTATPQPATRQPATQTTSPEEEEGGVTIPLEEGEEVNVPEPAAAQKRAAQPQRRTATTRRPATRNQNTTQPQPSTTQPNTTTQPQVPQGIDLEDEYYELDGF